MSEPEMLTSIKAGNINWKGRLSTIDLLIKVACFVKKENKIFVKRHLSEMLW